ncbi:dihydropyrimidinase [Mesorhizobium sp.]|uniref:dihydropyrimidinase n=1 Tax=Mesorhizobium sp. TaxID=1871066 RepID=UPI000FE61F34|nr:dihydropyrimidinase [Mesorhizobium sp.]RWD73630.1 MAG: dihydropyrimidinase [Mesorhizobium sp.]TIV61519.1 MAG: dihydropyrimidinase [Mesorhizobium sp.]
MDLIIKNGTVVTACDTFVADIGVMNGRISAIADTIDGDRGTQVIDAAGRLVMPGGVDVHTHLDTPGMLADTEDDFLSGTIAAAHGGTTTIINFCPQIKGRGLLESLAEHRRRADPKAVIDFALHAIVSDPSERALAELSALPGEGVTSFKLFMAYKGDTMVDDGTLIRVLHEARANGALVMVHAENGEAVEYLRNGFAAEGKLSPRYHALSRPPRVEAEATARAIALAELVGASIYIVHVSCGEALEEVVRGRRRGVAVHAETCAHYLHISDAVFEAPGFEGGKYVFTPPPRAKHQPKLIWDAIVRGDLEVVSSDHAPYNFHGGKDIGRDDFRQIPNGAPGIEERMTLVWQGVANGGLSPNRFVDLVATTPARIFGLYPAKGTIAVGGDADLVIWNPEVRRRLTQADLHSAVDYTMFEGMEVRGAPETVMSRGDVIVRGREFTGAAGRGRYIHRGTASSRKPVAKPEAQQS